MSEKNSIDVQVELLKRDKQYLTKRVDQLEKHLQDFKKLYTLLVQFIPVRNIVYGMVGTILVAFLTAILTVVVK